MKLSDIKKQKEHDLVPLDKFKLTEESLNLPNLHARWIDIYNIQNNLLVEARYRANIYKKKLSRYYKGMMMKREEWEAIGKKVQFQEGPLGKTELENYILGDTDYAKLNGKMEMIMSNIAYVESIIENIKQRGWAIKNAIEYEKYVGGM